jgi:hypothetical protein
MLPSLLQTHALVGQTTEQIKTLLGPPMDRTEYTYYAEIFAKSLPSNALVYWIAPQEGVMAFRSIWLVLAPDSTGTINSFEILHAGLQDVRNPDCKSFQLFRIDQTTRRIFVPGYSPGYFKDMKKIPPLPAQLRQAHAYVTKCQPSWGERWNISFFTDSKFAGYKDENQLENFLRDGSWAENYLAEYDNSTSRLTLFPAQQKLRQVLSAKLSP